MLGIRCPVAGFALRIAIFLFLLASSSFAASSCIKNATEVVILGQGGTIAIVLMLTAIGIAIVYMAGSATGNPRFTILAKDEL